MKSQPKWMISTQTLVLALVLAIGAVSPAKAIILQATDSVGDAWSNVVIDDGEQSDPPFNISGNNNGSGEGASLDVVFSATPGGDSSNLFAFDVTVTNSSSQTWGSYVFALGFEPSDAFEFATLTTGLYFAPGETLMSSVFTSVDLISGVHPHALVFYNGGNVVSPGQQVNFTFTIYATGDPSTFTLRQYAEAIPEPATVALLSLSLVGLGITRRRMQA
jgi:hypothetical protein